MATFIKALWSAQSDTVTPLLRAGNDAEAGLTRNNYGIMRHHKRPDLETVTNVTVHCERHFESPRIVSDIIIGFSDGLCVPFALVSGLASLGSSRVVVLAGLAELVSGAISMGLGGYLAGKSEQDHYDSELARERLEVIHDPEEEERECLEVFAPYGISAAAMQPVLEELKRDKEKWVDFMMRFELGLEKPSIRTAYVSGLTIGISYFIGGLIPLLPYFVITSTIQALYASIISTAVVLFVFGCAKASVVKLDNRAALCSGLQTLLIGAIAASSAFGMVRLLDQWQADP